MMNNENRNTKDFWDNKDIGWFPGNDHSLSEEEVNARVELCRVLQKKIDEDADQIVCFDKDEQKKRIKLIEDSQADQDGKKIRMGQYAGILSFRHKDTDWTVCIHSRFDETKTDGQYAERFLSYTLMHASVISGVRLDSFPTDAGSSLLSLLLPRAFLKQLAEAFLAGPFRQYRTFEHNDSRVRGQIDVARHIRLNPMNNGRIAYFTREYTLDNPVNHLILAACGILRRDYRAQMDSYLQSDPSLVAPIRFLESELGKEDISSSALSQLLSHAQDAITHPMLRHYEELRQLAIQIIRADGKNPFEGDGDKVSGILVYMPRIWELTLENAMSDLLSGAQVELEFLEGRRIAKPDLLLKNAVFDAKYRMPWTISYTNEKQQGKWLDSTREDIFQVLSYMYLFKRNIGGVIFPYPSDEVEEARPFKVAEQTCGDDTFWMIPFPIPRNVQDQEEFDEKMMASGRKLRDWVQKRMTDVEKSLD